MRNTEEFCALAEKYKDAVFRLAFSFIKSYADADDITQNVLLALYRSDRQFESDAHAKNWLMKVTANECRQLWRKPLSSDANIEDYINSLEYRDNSYNDLFSAIMQLDNKKRTSIVLYYIEGYSIKEISGILNVPEATVGTRLARARAELKTLLKEEVSE